jgi:aryl-phospho-beta-D-glucosidase BglC (GH1 family)
MCGITDTTDSGGRSARKTLETIYPDSMVALLVKTWEDHWITVADIDSIKSIGFNFMRVPFGWRTLQDQHQQWYLDSAGDMDFSRLDWIVSQAEQHHMYVLLDYHVWLDQDLAYNGISGTDSVVLSTCRIWKTVADHFKNNATVAGYDIVNEPTSSPGEYVKQMIYDTIRSVDPAHMISIEWTAIDTGRWQNVLYQDHWYGLTAASLDSNEAYFDRTYMPILHQADSFGVSYYIGETQVADDSSYAWSLNQYCLYNTNWSPWTYKTINEWGWGMISLYPNNVSVNLFSTPYDTILYRWSQVSNTGNWYELQNIKTIWSSAAQCINLSDGITPTYEARRPILYPNPASNGLWLLYPSSVISKHYSIVTMLGENIAGGDLVGDTPLIDIEGLASGVYMLKIDCGTAVYLKFIRE